MNRHTDALILALGNKNYRAAELAVQTLIAMEEPAVEALIAALTDHYAMRRMRAATILGIIGDRRAVEPLIGLLGDENDWVSGSALGALSKIGAPAIDPLIAALSDKNPKRRGKAAYILGAMGDPRAVEPLTIAIDDPDHQVRHWSSIALGMIGSPITCRIGFNTNAAPVPR